MSEETYVQETWPDAAQRGRSGSFSGPCGAPDTLPKARKRVSFDDVSRGPYMQSSGAQCTAAAAAMDWSASLGEALARVSVCDRDRAAADGEALDWGSIRKSSFSSLAETASPRSNASPRSFFPALLEQFEGGSCLQDPKTPHSVPSHAASAMSSSQPGFMSPSKLGGAAELNTADGLSLDTAREPQMVFVDAQGSGDLLTSPLHSPHYNLQTINESA